MLYNFIKGEKCYKIIGVSISLNNHYIKIEIVEIVDVKHNSIIIIDLALITYI